MKKILVFDMDGTIADFYNVKGWLKMLKNNDITPYKIAKPLYDPVVLNEILLEFKKYGWKIIITTWGSKHSTTEYQKEVAKTKKEWLKHYNFPYDYFYCVPYGTPKHTVTADLRGYQVLIDDNATVRKDWLKNMSDSAVIDANKDILKALSYLIKYR